MTYKFVEERLPVVTDGGLEQDEFPGALVPRN
jgi:hypothetical protein